VSAKQAPVADAEWELPELPAIGDRQLRRAIRRGVLRTAAVVAVYVLIGAFVLSIVVQGIFAGLGRQKQLEHIATAWQVAHPEFSADVSGSGPTWLGRQESLDVRLLATPPDPAALRVQLHTNLFGHLAMPTPVPQSVADEALLSIGTEPTRDWKSEEQKSLGQLPADTTLSAVLEFVRPLDGTSLQQWAAALPQSLSPSILASDTWLMTAVKQRTVSWNGVLEAPVYGWSFRDFHEVGNWTIVSSFRRWVSELHSSDAGNLHLVGVSLDRLRRAAAAGLVHGMIVTGVKPAQLEHLLADPAVLAAHTYQVAFASIP
jgi:hypothetical protein